MKIKDKTFRLFIPETEIKERVKAVAERINRDMEGKEPLFLAILNGSFIFAADLLRLITVPCEVSFVRLTSYAGLSSTGKVTEVIGIMQGMIETLSKHRPASVHVCTLLLKPEKLKVPLDIDYAAMEIPNDFIVGYGLDYDQQGRNLPDIYTVVE